MQRFVPYAVVVALVIVGGGGFVYGRMTNESTPVHAEDGPPKQTIVYSEGEEPVSAHFDFSGGEPLPAPDPPDPGFTAAELAGSKWYHDNYGLLAEFFGNGKVSMGSELKQWDLIGEEDGVAVVRITEQNGHSYTLRIAPFDGSPDRVEVSLEGKPGKEIYRWEKN